MKIKIQGLKKAVGDYKRDEKISRREYEGREHIGDYPVILLNTTTGEIWADHFYYSETELLYPENGKICVSREIGEYNTSHNKEEYKITMADVKRFVENVL